MNHWIHSPALKSIYIYFDYNLQVWGRQAEHHDFDMDWVACHWQVFPLFFFFNVILVAVQFSFPLRHYFYAVEKSSIIFLNAEKEKWPYKEQGGGVD